MLFQLGALTIDSPAGLNAQEASEEFGADYAVKARVGAQPTREAVGVADRTFTIVGTIYPYFQARNGVSSGLNEVGLLKQIAYAQEPQVLINGAGENLGWFLVLKVQRHDGVLSLDGVGRVINYTLTLAESPHAASAASTVGTILSLYV